MRPKWVLLALVLALNSAVGGEPVKEPLIRMPVMQAEVTPIAPDATVKLDASKLYVIDSELQLLTLCSPNGVLKVVEEPGPIRIRGLFADGNGKVQTRNYKGKFVYTVEVADGKSGLCELLVVPVGVKAESEVIRRMIEAGNGPQPPPDPKPNPKPDPVDPIDNSSTSLKIYYIEETSLAAATRGALFADVALDARMKAKHHTFRVADQNVKSPDGVNPPADLVPYLGAAKGKGLPQLFLVDTAGKMRFQGDAPVKAADLLALITKYGG